MKNAIEVSHFTKKYGDFTAVDDISFEVKEGELFAFLGPNGAGKSTTINTLCTLIEKTAGEISLNGFKLGAFDTDIRKSIGVVFQGNVLDDVLTAEENLLSRATFYNMTASKARERVGYLAKRLSMESFLKTRYGKLSGGQRRKCDVARALLAQPKILFLDEPTTGLDPQSRIELWETIEEIRKADKMTIFLTTHYMEETENAERVAIIDKGKIMCIDTPQALKSCYSNDVLKLVVKPEMNAQLEKMLGEHKFELRADTYTINLKNGIEAIDFLPALKPFISSFELKKGNMDSVFLNVVGRSFSNE